MEQEFIMGARQMLSVMADRGKYVLTMTLRFMVIVPIILPNPARSPH